MCFSLGFALSLFVYLVSVYVLSLSWCSIYSCLYVRLAAMLIKTAVTSLLCSVFE